MNEVTELNNLLVFSGVIINTIILTLRYTVSGLLSKYKRAISPVVTTLFLMAVILGAIAASLAIIFPAVNRLDDQILLETSGSSLGTLDESIQKLILNGVDSEIYSEVKTGTTGAMLYDNRMFSTVQLLQTNTVKYNSQINHSRLQIQQVVSSEWFAQGSHQYFSGQGDQSIIFLNSSSRRFLGWSIINQSRPVGSDIVTSSLYYRNIVSSSNVVSNQANNRYFNLTINIQMVNFTIPSGIKRDGATKVGLGLHFTGTQVKYTDWIKFNDSMTMKIGTESPEAGNAKTTEIPLRAEKPAGIPFNIRIKYIYNIIEVSL